LRSFKWREDESLEAAELPAAEELATDAIAELESTVDHLDTVVTPLEDKTNIVTEGEVDHE